jgi:hypothetical protein
MHNVSNFLSPNGLHYARMLWVPGSGTAEPSNWKMLRHRKLLARSGAQPLRAVPEAGVPEWDGVDGVKWRGALGYATSPAYCHRFDGSA